MAGAAFFVGSVLKTAAVTAGSYAAANAGTIATLASAGASMYSASQKPDIPDAPAGVPQVVESGEEGIRRGSIDRLTKRRKQAFLTRGQERDTGAKLGGMAKTLG